METGERTAPSVKERLILEGLREIETRGLAELSLRRVATACGLSCAAPYKHFADKRSLCWQLLSISIRNGYVGDALWKNVLQGTLDGSW